MEADNAAAAAVGRPTDLYAKDLRPFSMDYVELREQVPRALPLTTASRPWPREGVGPHPAKAYHLTMWMLDGS